jgi:hypothetical protein
MDQPAALPSPADVHTETASQEKSSAAAVTQQGNIKGGGAGPIPRSEWLRGQLSSSEWSALVSVRRQPCGVSTRHKPPCVLLIAGNTYDAAHLLSCAQTTAMISM